MRTGVAGKRLDAATASLLGVGVVAAAGLALLVGGGHLANELLLGDRVWNLDADVDANALAWLSSVATFAAALCAAALAAVEPARRAVAAGVAAVLAFFSLDDMLVVHERVGVFVTEDVLGLGIAHARYVWPALFLPLLAAAAAGLVLLARGASAGGRHVLAGIGLLVGAIAAEVLSAAINLEDEELSSTAYAIEVAIEEAAEVAGWTLVAFGLAAAALVRLAALLAPSGAPE